MTAILGMPISTATNLIFKAIEHEQDEKAWDLWSGMYPMMASGILTFIPFEKFKEELFEVPKKYSKKSKEEIIKEMEEIKEKFERR